MPKYRITWQVANYGASSEIIEADTQTKAELIAYKACLEEAESMLSYHAKELKPGEDAEE